MSASPDELHWSFHVGPGRARVETQGSVWTFDEKLMRYHRLPKHEQPRERPEWSDEQAGQLQDVMWHGYTSWRITDQPYVGNHPEHGRKRIPKGSLVIEMPDGTWTVAPGAHVLT